MTTPEIGQTVTVYWPVSHSFSPAVVHVVSKSGQILVTIAIGGQVWLLPDQLRRKAPKR